MVRYGVRNMSSGRNRPRAHSVMVCGTTSGAGKSFLTTALARYYARQGLKVAPFKAQNMSNNARVVAGGEIGSAQYLQALAAGRVPEVRMNPVLLKPERDTHSQVVLLGQRDDRLAAMEWRQRARELWPTVTRCLSDLMEENDLLVIEGAGSPAEINLQDTDIVNLRVAEAADAATLLVCDIDRGGAFAHLYGTCQLVPERQRSLIRGFVLNKFRGDPALLAPAPERLRELTGIPVLGVLPMWREHGLPEEDGVFDEHPTGSGFAVSIVAYPCISNLDEFAPLQRIPGLAVRWGRTPAALAEADLLILPGSKHVANDLAWLRSRALDDAICAHVAAGKPVLSVCGGLQMVGRDLHDPHEVEGAGEGLGLLGLRTVYEPGKQYRRGDYTFGPLSGFWKPLSGISFSGYEIRHGRSEPAVAGSPRAPREVIGEGLGWQEGEILSLYTHGIFENAAVLKAMFGAAVPTLQDTFDGLADFVEAHLGAATLDQLRRA
jgi:adenosylcobyric acid synthase